MAIIDSLAINTKMRFIATVGNTSELINPTKGDVCYDGKTTWVYTGTKWESLDTTLAFSINTSSSSLEESPKIIYKSITNCTNCGGLLSWQSIYDSTIRCSYCGSILQKEVLK